MRRIVVIVGLAVSLALSMHVGAYGNPVNPYYDEYPCPDGYPVKGNITTYDGELIYHIPEGDFYNVTRPEQCFATEQDAIYYGYRKSLR